jgi:ribosomal protein L37AE/L43A
MLERGAPAAGNDLLDARIPSPVAQGNYIVASVMYVLASGPGGPGGVGKSQRPRPESPGLLFPSSRSFFRGGVDPPFVSALSATARTGRLLRSVFRRLGRNDPDLPDRTRRPAPLPSSSPALEPEPSIDALPRPLVPASEAPVPRVSTPGYSPRSESPGSCPACSVPFLPVGATGSWSCPLCGRQPAALQPRFPAESGTSPPERRNEELLAAWMIGRPMPCSQCSGVLRRVAVGEFRCPSCGNRVKVPELSPDLSGTRRAGAPQGTIVDGGRDSLDVGGEGPVRGERGHQRA